MIDTLIIITYLIVTVIVGFIYGRGIKSIRDFSVADKTFPTAALVATVFATWMGGEDLIGFTERVYSIGIVFLIITLGMVFSLLVHAYVIAPKILKNFEDKISVGEIMGELYGNTGKVIAGISNMLYSVGLVTIQVSCIGYLCNLVWGMPHFYGTIIGSLVIIAYSSFGGIRSVIFTDILQFGILIVTIPLMANFILYDIGGIEALMTKLPDFYKTIDTSGEEFPLYLAMLVVWLFPYFNPILIQRILMAKNTKQASDSLMISGLLFVPFYGALTIIALVAVLKFPDIDPNFAFLNSLNFSLPPILKGLAISGVLAVSMSTADSFLNVCSISAAREIAVVVWPKISDRTQLLLARLVTVVFGFLSIFIAAWFYSLIDLLVYFLNFWCPTVVAPMILYMFGIINDKKSYVISAVIGVCATFAFRSIGSEEFNIISHLVGMCFTIASMLVFYKCGFSSRALAKKSSKQ